MPYVSCLECGSPVADTALMCPTCGRSMDGEPIRVASRVAPLASIAQRVVARAVDILIVYTITIVLATLLIPGAGWGSLFGGDGAGAGAYLLLALIWSGYFAALEAGDGRTLGKAAVGIRTTALDHVTAIGPGNAFVRNLVLVIPLLWPVTLGVMALDTVRRQGFHDKMVQSIVVME